MKRWKIGIFGAGRGADIAGNALSDKKVTLY